MAQIKYSVKRQAGVKHPFTDDESKRWVEIDEKIRQKVAELKKTYVEPDQLIEQARNCGIEISDPAKFKEAYIRRPVKVK